jgi:hypothetical protein
VDNDSFSEDITSKLYPKYQYQAVSKGPKRAGKEAFLNVINGFSSGHSYSLNPSKKRGYCFFCLQKSNLGAQKEQESANFLFQKTFRLNQEDLIEVPKRKEPKRERFRGKYIKWWCKECDKFICKDCWSLYH